MEEALWIMGQESRELQDLRADVRGVWQDGAARELNGRYLDPHEEDDRQMLAALNEQKESLSQARAQLETAADLARQADEHSGVVADKLRLTEQDLNHAYNIYDVFVRYRAEAQMHTNQAQGLISQANSAGA